MICSGFSWQPPLTSPEGAALTSPAGTARPSQQEGPPSRAPETAPPLSLETRRRAVRSLYRRLLDLPRFAEGMPSARERREAAADVARAMEHGIAVWSQARSRPYSRKLYSLFWVLRHEPSAAALLTRHQPWEVAFVKEDSMMREQRDKAQSSAVAALGQKLDRLEATLKSRLTAPRRSCPRCGCRDMERIALQLRAADEGMTTMLQCTNCSQRVRI